MERREEARGHDDMADDYNLIDMDISDDDDQTQQPQSGFRYFIPEYDVVDDDDHDHEFVSTWEYANEHGVLPNTDPDECPQIEWWHLVNTDRIQRQMYTVIKKTYRHFRTHYRRTDRLLSSYCIRLPLYGGVIVPRLKHWLRQIFLDQTTAFKLDFSFSFLLVLREDYRDAEAADNTEDTPDVRSFISSANSLNFFQGREDGPPLITTREDMDSEVLDRLTDEDLRANCILSRPDTKWEFLSYLGVCVYVTRMPDVPLGRGPRRKRCRFIDDMCAADDDDSENSEDDTDSSSSSSDNEGSEEEEEEAGTSKEAKRRKTLREALPRFITSNRAIHTLLGTYDGKTVKGYEDNTALCFFRALAVWETGESRRYEMLARERFQRFIEHLRTLPHGPEDDPLPAYARPGQKRLLGNIRQFPGVQEREIRVCEQLFRLNVQMWTLEPLIEGKRKNKAGGGGDLDEYAARVIRYPAAQYPSDRTIHLLKHGRHLCLIRDVAAFCKRYRCTGCDRIFSTIARLQRHWSGRKRRGGPDDGCDKGLPRSEYPGGTAGRKITLWDELGLYFGITIPPTHRFYVYRLTWDIETYGTQDQPEEQPHQKGGNEEDKIGFFSDHDFTEDRPPTGHDQRERTLDTFIRKNWSDIRSDQSRKNICRVRTCQPRRDFNKPPTTMDETFPLSASDVLHWLVEAISSVSRKKKVNNVRADVHFTFCVEQEREEYPEMAADQPSTSKPRTIKEFQLVKSVKWFSEWRNSGMVQLPDHETARQCAYQSLIVDDDEAFEREWAQFVEGVLGDKRRLVGLLAFEVEQHGAAIQHVGEMVPMSIAAASNIPGFEEPAFFLNANDDDWNTEAGCERLVESFLDYCERVSVAAERLMNARMRHYFKEAKKKIRLARQLCRPFAAAMKERSSGADGSVKDILRAKGHNDEAIRQLHVNYSACKNLERTYEKLRAFCRVLPVIGFNSGKFDVPALRRWLLPALVTRAAEQSRQLATVMAEMAGEDEFDAGSVDSVCRGVQALVRGQKYVSISTARLRFLDALNYTSPMTYSALLKAWGVTEVEKLKFPFDAVTSPAVLRQAGLPPREKWSNWLLGEKNVSDLEWAEIQKMWNESGFETLEQCLRSYNQADCTGLLLTCAKMHQFWREMYAVDAFVEGVSLPGLSWESLMKSLPPFTILQRPNPQHADFQQDAMKAALIGGPSIIFTRYCEVGETKMPSGALCGSLHGYDVNGLYSYCYTLPMPSCVPGLRFRPKEQTTIIAAAAAGDNYEVVPMDISSDQEEELEAGTNQQGSSSPTLLNAVDVPMDQSSVEQQEEDALAVSTNPFLDAFVDEIDEEEERPEPAAPSVPPAAPAAPPTSQPLDDVVFESEPTERFWRKQTEYLAWSCEYKQRLCTEEEYTLPDGNIFGVGKGAICRHHEPLGKFFNGREIRVGGPMGPPADGACPHCCLVTQFHGCIWHCHSNCLNPNTNRVITRKWTPEQIAEKRARNARVEKAIEDARKINPRWHLEIMWECQWDRMKKDNLEIRKFIAHRFPYYPKTRKLTGSELLERVRTGKWTGFLTVDCHISEEAWDEYQRFPVLFFHREVSVNDLRGEMRAYAQRHGLLKQPQRVLVSGMRATRFTILSPYLRDLLLNRRVIVTRIYEAMWYPLRPVFADFFRNLQQQRMEAQRESNSGRSQALKLCSNSIYGRSCMNRSTQTETVICTADAALERYVNTPRFRQLQVLKENEYYQICLAKKQITYDIPCQLAVSCLNYAKQNIIFFVWDYLMRFCGNNCRLLFMDTDSIYVGLSGASLADSLVNPDQDRATFEEASSHFLDDKIPGKMKLEMKDGVRYVGLSSKSYSIQRGDRSPVKKAKGVQKRAAKDVTFDHYRSALDHGREISVVNRGFHMARRPGAAAQELSMQKTRVAKVGLRFMYQKRHLSPTDPYDTIPLEMDP